MMLIFSLCAVSIHNIYCNKLIEAKTEATLLDSFRLIDSYFPYVGIIQIRFSVEGRTFLSACIQAPVDKLTYIVHLLA